MGKEKLQAPFYTACSFFINKKDNPLVRMKGRPFY